MTAVHLCENKRVKIALKAASTNSRAGKVYIFHLRMRLFLNSLAGQPVTPKWMMIHVVGAVVMRMRRVGEDKI